MKDFEHSFIDDWVPVSDRIGACLGMVWVVIQYIIF